MVASIAAWGGLSSNGTAPVKTFVRMNQVLHMSSEYTTDFNHDHRERKDIRLLAKCPTIGQDLRRHPPHAVPVLVWGPPYRIQALSDHGETTICDDCMPGGVHKDV